MPGGMDTGNPDETEIFRRDLLAGLKKEPKSIPCKYLWDIEGSRLFERICELDEYYPTRTELSILERHVDDMARRLGPRSLLIEYGTGVGVKTQLLLDALDDPVGYIPIDIACNQMDGVVSALEERHPDLEVKPVCADYTGPYRLPPIRRTPERRVVFFPGSTIGNFVPDEAGAFLGHIAGVVGEGGALLIGVDLEKDPSMLERAYDDRAGVTAEFNLNLLARANRELGADFDLQKFRHRAVWNEREGRVEMHLVILEDHPVRIGTATIRFREGETIHTENAYKYTLDRFDRLARSAGFRVQEVWTDDDGLFSVQYLTVVAE